MTIVDGDDEGHSGARDVATYFDSRAAYWHEIYDAPTVQGAIYRDRAATVLRWIDGLALPTGSTVLEVGCGSGRLTVQLARQGYRVEAVDPSSAMIERTLESLGPFALAGGVRVSRGSVESLAFPDDSFDLVVGIGVLPWVNSAPAAVAEMARVVAAGGHVLITADNPERLNLLLDPRLGPWTAPARRWLNRLKPHHRRLRGRRPSFHRMAMVDDAIRRAGLRVASATTIGFGPFSLFGAEVLGPAWGIRVHRRLQWLADHDAWVLRSTGSHYAVLAQKPGP